MTPIEEALDKLKDSHDKLQEFVSPTKMQIRKGIFVDVGEGEYDNYPRYGFQFFCWRSPEMVKEMDCFIKYASGKTCLLDVGAYHGIFSLVFCAINEYSTAYAFEPYLKQYSILEKICKQNGRITTIPCALGSKMEIVWMGVDGGHLTVVKTSGEITKVQVVIGDEVCVTNKIIPDAIKVDVEGAELSVIRGLRQTIVDHHPTIFLELHRSIVSDQETLEMVTFFMLNNYKAIDTETDSSITWGEIMSHQLGELRIVLV